MIASTMMVPRTFVFTSAVTFRRMVEKDERPRSEACPPSLPRTPGQPLQDDSGDLRIPSKLATGPQLITHTNPVVIPPKRAPRKTSINQAGNSGDQDVGRTASGSIHRSPSNHSLNRELPPSVATLLEATAIPVPRRSWARRNCPRKLPPGNHVEDFSRLLTEGIKRCEDDLIGSGNTTLDILLLPPEYDEKLILASELESGTPPSACSLSVDSVPSLDNEWISTPSVPAILTPSSQRSVAERKPKSLSPTEDCASDHPLLEEGEETSDLANPPVLTLYEKTTSSKSTPTPARTFPSFGSTFKSNLTASLRAIKSAAQTVSNFTSPSVHPEDFLTRSLFAITPKLTDDRRPRPMAQPPSPALRRYLNPTTLSPVEMHIHHDHPPDAVHLHRYCSASIQMQTYRRFGSSYSGCDQQPCSLSDSEGPPMAVARQREPRENSNFLRMVVLEMNMRRSGKLRDDIPIRARVWLPPRKVVPTRLPSLCSDEVIPKRWAGESI